MNRQLGPKKRLSTQTGLAFWLLPLAFGLFTPTILSTNLLMVAAQEKSLSTPTQTPQDKKLLADRLFEQGTKQLAQNQPQAAITSFEQALVIYQELKDVASQGQTLKGIGNAYLDQKNYSKALNYQQQTLKVARLINDRDLESRALNNIGIVYKEKKQPERAIFYYQESIRVSRSSQNLKMVVITLGNLATVYNSQKEFAQAIATLQEALPIAQRIPDRAEVARIFAAIGDNFYNNNQYDPAISHYQQGLAIAQEVNDKSLQAIILVSMGDSYKNQKQYDLAIAHYQQGLAIAQKDNLSLQANVFASIGDSYKNQKQYDPAIAAYQQALKRLRTLNNQPAFEATILQITGSIYYLQEQYDLAIEYHQQALTIYRQISNTSEIWRSLQFIGFAYSSKKNIKAAIAYHQQALEVAQTQWKNPKAIAESTIRLGFEHIALKEYLKASTYFDTALATYQKLDDQPNQLTAMTQLMSVYYLLNLHAGRDNDTQAMDYVDRVIQMAPAALRLATTLKDSAAIKSLQGLESSAHTRMGQAYLRQQDFSQAYAFIQKGVLIAQQSENLQTQSSALLALYEFHNARGENAKKAEVVQQRLDLERSRKDALGEAMNVLELAEIAALSGDMQKAIAGAQQALQQLEQIDLSTEPEYRHASIRTFRYLSLNHLSGYYLYLGDYNKALELAQQTLQFARSITDPEKEINALIKLGQVYTVRQEFQAAIASLQQAKQLAQTKSQPKLETDALIQLSNTWLAQNNYVQAHEAAEQAVDITQRPHPKLTQKGIFAVDPSSNQAYALYTLGRVYYAQGNYPKYLELLQAANTLSQQSPNLVSQAIYLIVIGEVYHELGDYQKATEHYQQMLTLWQQASYPTQEAYAWYRLAAIAFDQGEPQKTIELAQKGIAVARQNQALWLERQTYAVLSLGYGELGDDPKAIAAAQKSLEIARKIGSRREEKFSLTLLGNLHRRFNRLDKALTYYEAALAVNEEGSSTIYASLGRIYADRQQPGAAIVFYKQAINSIEVTRRNLQGLPSELQQSFLQATVDFGQLKTADIYRQLADLLLSQGRIPEAQQVLELLKIQEINDFKQPVRSPKKISDLAINEVEERILKEYGTLVALGRKITNCQQTQCAQLNQLLNQQTTLQNQYNQAIRSIETKIRANRSLDDNYLDPRNEFGRTASAIIKAQPGTILIYPLVLEDKLWLLLATEGGLLKRYQVNVNQKELGETVLTLQTLLRSDRSNVKDLQQISQKLYSWLIQPLEKELKDANANGERKVKNLVFALDRVTRYIPTSVLFDGKQYLIENYTVSTILGSSQSNWRDRLPLKPEHVSALALGVSEAYSGFSALPNVPVELNTVVKKEKENSGGIYPGLQFLNNTFSFEALRNNLYGRSIVHIATHGKFVPGRSEDSYLLLGTGEKLAIPQIETLQNLDDVHLVVLSACETALGGPGKDGVEINGISSYFLSQGAKAVIASLWLVNDASTSLLMQKFYENLAPGNTTKAEALRQAQLKLLKKQVSAKEAPDRSDINILATKSDNRILKSSDFSHPYYWAPFILIGNSL